MNNQIIHLDRNTQNILRSSIPNKRVCDKLACLYSMFSDSTRLKIIVSLLCKEMCVNDLSNLLEINQTTISHQLKILKHNGAVSTTRTGKYIFYQVNNKFITNIMLNGVDYISASNVG